MMFQGWRIRLREADEAFSQGRLHDAERILREAKLLEYLPGRRLGDKIAAKLAERARGLMIRGESVEAWRDMATARSLGGDTEATFAVRREMTELGIEEIETRLRAGDTSGALRGIAQIEPHTTQLESVRGLRTIAERIARSRELGDRGKFAEAAEQVESMIALRPNWPELAAWRDRYREKGDRFRADSAELHRALSTENWHDVVSLADQLLAIAPECRLARDVRQRAWAKVGSPLRDSRSLAETHSCGAPGREPAVPAKGMDRRRLDDPARFRLWVDGVGGFLVCARPELRIGQAAPGSDVDLAMLGDLSRTHATIRREGDGYVLEPTAATRIGGRPIDGPALLRDEDVIELGPSIRLRFRQPHALSATARIDFASSHRPQPSVDGVLLMAESCVLGPRKSNHVLCREWAKDVILFQRDGRLYCRASEPIEIDGNLFDGRGEITRRSRIVGGDFTLSTEPA
ncbi:MAG: FHA domain-containing protein [Planctomycetes bacterium]|nr:FHA domain-containing protein [Planctomycetota bacterium]